ncbi:MAG: hypothetical protein OXU20_28675 [Myxococcales bacterium]|nr:hypothetical protein [Myxococcales bacterium]
MSIGEEHQGDVERSDAFWQAAEPAREPARTRYYVPVVLVLTVASIPFYWSGAGEGIRVLGLPAWVWMAVACSAGISLTTAWGAFRDFGNGDPGAPR